MSENDRFKKMLRNFLECLLCASEKAALIARACRSEASLFELLSLFALVFERGIILNARSDGGIVEAMQVVLQKHFRLAAIFLRCLRT